MWAGERNTPEGWDVLTSSTVLFQPQRWQCPTARPRGSGRQSDGRMPGETGLDISYSGLPGLSSQAEGDRPCLLDTGRQRPAAPGPTAGLAPSPSAHHPSTPRSALGQAAAPTPAQLWRAAWPEWDRHKASSGQLCPAPGFLERPASSLGCRNENAGRGAHLELMTTHPSVRMVRRSVIQQAFTGTCSAAWRKIGGCRKE